MSTQLFADVVIIGDGIAGLSAALALKEQQVLVLTKAAFGRGGSTPLAQGGIACAMDKGDDPDYHTEDTLIAGDGLSVRETVDILTHEGPQNIRKLLEIGTQFDRDSNGNLYFGREAAHSHRRILHAHGDSTGAEVERSLTEAVRQQPNIRVIDHCYVADFILNDGAVCGVHAVCNNEILYAIAPAVILASGGIGRLYQYTTNPVESVGDGIAMAARAGAELADIEFIQFHPTALCTKLDPLPLLTEALRGEGATLVDENGSRFMQDIHKDAELAPRDVVARGIWSVQQRGSRVFLDARCVGENFPNRFPTVWGYCQQIGLDPRKDLLPVSPAAHYHMGGVKVDANGQTSLKGLWTCGEASSTGVHGANRLASNSLLEGIVFGARVGNNICETTDFSATLSIHLPEADNLNAFLTEDEIDDAARLRKAMWDYVGVVRCAEGMQKALDFIEETSQKHPNASIMFKNMLCTSKIIAQAALDRKESRGGHYRSDYPEHAEIAEHHFFTVKE